MSSWMADWERSLIRPTGPQGKYRTQCKLGRHALMEDTPARWVTDSGLAPLGLSCVACLKERAAELGVDVPAEPVAAKVPAKRRVKPPEELVHGRASTYSIHKCRCVPCREANSARSASYRAARRAQVPA